MTYRWQTDPDGTVAVQEKPGELAATWVLMGAEADVFDAKVWRWRELCEKESHRTGVPTAWLLGTIFTESRGNPNAIGHDPGGTKGLGLCQITAHALKQGLPDSEVMKPEVNIRLAADALAAERRNPHIGNDLPKAGSGYNAGYGPKGPRSSTKSPWGMVETSGHISRLVRSTNYAFRRLAFGPRTPDSGDGGSLAPVATCIALALVLWS
jgi:soluble lytic murein transglycosylase-like protein